MLASFTPVHVNFTEKKKKKYFYVLEILLRLSIFNILSLAIQEGYVVVSRLDYS